MARKKIGDIELQWTCPNCNGLNPGSARFCQSCGAAQPEDVEFHLPQHQELVTDAEKLAHAAAGPDIHCPYCGTRNPGNAHFCQQCGGDLSEGARREQGKVLGAFESGPPGTVTCPNCGSENPDTALKCMSCGASLAPEPVAVPQPASRPAAGPRPRLNPLVIAGVVIAAVLLCGLLAVLLLRGAQTDDLRATVQSARWELAIPVEALVEVENRAWEDQVPADAELGQCEQNVREVVDQPVANSVEVCGTPYTVDSGSGFAEVVQDCSYEVYDAYCSYTTLEWRQVDLAVANGSGFSPAWPSPGLQDSERLGNDRRETYTVIFDAGTETYTYQTGDFNEYEKYQPGTSWTLVVNGFGSLVGVEP